MRTPIMAGNWKMHFGLAVAAALAREVRAAVGEVEDATVVLAPPFTALAAVADAVRGSRIRVAAQDMFWADSGAFTGEVSPSMVAELASHVILGHSERRALFGETDEDVGRKVHAAVADGLVPLVCVGESEAERDAGATDEVVGRQLGALEGLAEAEAAGLVVAYEPVWAIGTGRACEPEEAQRVAGLIRARLAGDFGPAAAGSARVLYGGSVKPANVAAYLSAEDIDGALVGGASLAAETFLPLVRAAQPVAAAGR
jgi:triosephosphate isomerase